MLLSVGVHGLVPCNAVHSSTVMPCARQRMSRRDVLLVCVLVCVNGMCLCVAARPNMAQFLFLLMYLIHLCLHQQLI